MGVHAALLVRSRPPPVKAKPLLLTTLRASLLSQCLIIGFILISSFTITVYGAGASSYNDTIALLKFKESLLSSTDTKEDPLTRLALSSWNSNGNTSTACVGNYANWVGVMCADGNVWGLQLENMSLAGVIDVNSLVQLPSLRALSFTNNTLEGPLPDFKKLGSLSSLDLSYNQFSGQIPNDAFADMPNLRKLYLANNQFGGTIPISLGQLSQLLDLSLADNHFVGRIPKYDQNNNLKVFNVSNNQLEGPIPSSLSKFGPASFSGNQDLCGTPLLSVCKYPLVDDSPPPNPSNASSDASSPRDDSSMLIAILAISCSGLVVGVIIVVVVIICYRRRNEKTPRLGNFGSASYNNTRIDYIKDHVPVSAIAPFHRAPVKKSEDGKGGDHHPSSSSLSSLTPLVAADHKMSSPTTANMGKLSFIREDRRTFDLQDLLRASAEVLGSGNFGSSYKAVLMDGKSVVVKRFKMMNNVDRHEFNNQMTRLGKLNHPNLVPLVAYYYRKEEKLLVSYFIPNGSLASHLHGNRRSNQPALDWPARLTIVKGVAKGMFYLYKEMSSLIVSHGHLKSSNVLLDESLSPILMDYSLVPMMNQEHAQRIMIAYRSPEYIQHGRLTKKTDVWSLGILILELLTGKFPPPNYQLPTAKGTSVAGAGAGAGDLISWVDSIVKEAEALQVFDKDLLAATDCEGEMLKLFQIGMACCEEDVSKRLDLQDAVDKIQGLNERDGTHNYVLCHR